MFNSKFNSSYVSEIDQFLQELNKLPGIKSDERLAEEHKYQIIFALRDVPSLDIPRELAWKDF